MKPQYRITFYTEGLPFDGNPIEDKSLGGAESACWAAAKALAERGHKVTVFCPTEAPGRYDGVRYESIQLLRQAGYYHECDVYIVSRFAQAFGAPIKSHLRWYWSHDVPTREIKQIAAYVGSFADRVLVLSDYHEALFHAARPDEVRADAWHEGWNTLLWRTSNGVDIERMKRCASGIRRNRNRVLFASRPERGLDYLLAEIWPRLREAEPELELHVSTYDTSALGVPEVYRTLYAYCEHLLERTPGVVRHGSLTKRQYYKLMASCSLFLYPARWPEVSCINALEAMALRTPIVTTNDFALAYTVPYPGIEGMPLPPSPEYVDGFVKRTLELVRNDIAREKLADQGEQHVIDHYQWKHVIGRWEEEMTRQFSERSRERYEVSERLEYEGNLVHAQELMLDVGDHDAAARLSDLMSREPLPTEVKAAQDPTMLEVYTRAVAQRILALPKLTDITLDDDELYDEGARVEAFVKQKNPEVRITRAASGEQARAVVSLNTLQTVADPTGAVRELEAHCQPGGTLLIVVPAGPWEAQDLAKVPSLQRGRRNLWSFDQVELAALFKGKADLAIEYAPAMQSPRNEALGWWIIRYTNDPTRETGTLDMRRRHFLTRPHTTLALCMIVKNGALDLPRCLTSAAPIADKMVIAVDRSSNDGTLQVLEQWQAEHPYPPLEIRSFDFEDFAQARNVSIENVDADWILWLDADEELVTTQAIRAYLEGHFFQAYSLRQNHWVLDMSRRVPPDLPLRIFRNNGRHKFYGCVHEDLAESTTRDTMPSFVLPEPDILHYGYTHEGLRRRKAAARNLALLLKDRKLHPERAKGVVLVAREELQIAQWQFERSGGVVNERILQLIRASCMIYLTNFASETDPWHEHAHRYYQEALRWLARNGLEVQPGWGVPFEVAQVTIAARGGLNGQLPPMPETRWFANGEEYETFMIEQGKRMRARLNPEAGIIRRASVMPALTAAAGNGSGNGAPTPEVTHGSGPTCSSDEAFALADAALG